MTAQKARMIPGILERMTLSFTTTCRFIPALKESQEMRRSLKVFLVCGFAVAAMSYAVWQADIPILPVASAEWANGCCNGTNDCSGTLVCFNRPKNWAACRVDCAYPEGVPDCVETPNYCNPAGQDPGGGDGIVIEGD
jgi:hypothetical protein